MPTMLSDELKQVETDLSVELPDLIAAAEHSVAVLKEARRISREYLTKQGVIRAGQRLDNKELGIVAFGSLARQELSSNPETSDFDYAIVAYKAVEQPDDIPRYRLAAIRAQIDLDLGKPGQQKIFGGVVAASDLTNQIGLEDDTNRSHTQRVLFLEESVAIVDEFSHQTTLQSILKRYLSDYRNDEDDSPFHKPGVPRFLLNDVVRYWRTVAVDYQAKRWDELAYPADFFPSPMEVVDPDGPVRKPTVEDPQWGLRYLKLRSTRKLAYVGSLVSLLMPYILARRVDDAFLLEQFTMPPLARLAQLRRFMVDEDLVKLGEIFELADAFMKRLNDSDFRKAVRSVRHPRQPGDNALFVEARELTQELEIALEQLFCSQKPLKTSAPALDPDGSPLSLFDLTARYLLF